jgi:phytoene synthase
MSGEMRLISKAGKTFYFATLWLERSLRHEAALAYDFCRTVDDIADGAMPESERDSTLREIQRAVIEGDTTQELVKRVAPLLARYPDVREPLAALVEACREDTPLLRIAHEEDLERYAFGVAGNVGLVMYPILGGERDEGRSHAADLGIAMQYTNIARDIFEDLARNREYLPREWLGERSIRELFAHNSSSEEIVVEAVRRLLRLADERYARGLYGLRFLAPQNRFAINLAARCYAAIGEGVIRNGRLARERSVVSLARKVTLACSMGLFGDRKRAWEAAACER